MKHISKSQLRLEWSSTSMNDKIADSVIAVILNIENSPASIKGNYLTSFYKLKLILQEKILTVEYFAFY